VRGAAAGRDIAEALVRSSRTARRSNPGPQPQSATYVFNGDIQIKGTMFGPAPDEDLEHSQRSRPTLPATQNAHAYTVAATRIQRPRRAAAYEDGEVEEESEDIEPDRNSSAEDERSQPSPISRSTPTSAQRVQTWQDSGYGSSTRRSKQGKNEVYRARLDKKLSNGSLGESNSLHNQKKRKPRGVELNESNVEDSATSEDIERHSTTQGDGGGDNEGDSADDSDDVGYMPCTNSAGRQLTSSQDFTHRNMKVSTVDDKEVAVHVLLDTGTKPDWISSSFMSETLGRKKWTKLNTEENKRSFTDFNDNKFNAIGKADIVVLSTDFGGFQCRTISFLVAKARNFEIILGSRTIQKENLLCRPLDPQREGAYPAKQTEIKKREACL
jgi:hypothetical protein